MKLALLKEQLQNIAFDVCSGAPRKEIHASIVDCLSMLCELEQSQFTEHVSATSDTSTVNEVNKVARRLKLWAKRAEQYNSRLLVAYLSLKQNGIEGITEAMLREHFGDDRAFNDNFPQMKAISEKNHGKVFEMYGEYVDIWEPVKHHVREFEARVFDVQKT